MRPAYIAHHIVVTLDEWATRVQLAVGERAGCLVTLYFHHLFAEQSELASATHMPQERITVSGFRAILEEFLEAGYRFTSPAEILAGLDPARKHLLITFDDGYADNLRVLPLLEEFKAMAIVFISAHHIRDQKPFWQDVLWRERRADGTPESEIARQIQQLVLQRNERSEEHVRKVLGGDAMDLKEDTSRPLAIEGLRTLAAHPLVVIGNHTCNHVSLLHCEERVAREEIAGAQSALRDLIGSTPMAIAYPYGLYDHRVAQMAAEAGLKLGFTTAPRKTYVNQLSTQNNRMTLGRFLPVGTKNLTRQCRYFRSDIMLHSRYQTAKGRLKSLLGRADQM